METQEVVTTDAAFDRQPVPEPSDGEVWTTFCRVNTDALTGVDVHSQGPTVHVN